MNAQAAISTAAEISAAAERREYRPGSRVRPSLDGRHWSELPRARRREYDELLQQEQSA